jgi:hypothetical protein
MYKRVSNRKVTLIRTEKKRKEEKRKGTDTCSFDTPREIRHLVKQILKRRKNLFSTPTIPLNRPKSLLYSL